MGSRLNGARVDIDGFGKVVRLVDSKLWHNYLDKSGFLKIS